MLLIHNDQAERLDGGEDGRTRTDHDAGAALADLVPLIVPLAGAEVRVEHGDLRLQRAVAEARLEALDGLRRKRNLRHEHDGALPLRQRVRDGLRRRALVALLVPLALLAFAPAQTAEPVVVLAAGDIAYCTRTGDESTAALIDANPDATVLALGDLAYEDGSAQQFADCYGPSWGRHKARTRPVPGNHEYHQAGAAPYFAYFGTAAGESGNGYYTYTLGTWHVVALGNVLGFRAVVERGELVATLSRQNRQSRSYTLGPGTHQTVNVLPNIQLGRDPETGAFTITRGNAVLTLAWSDA